MPTSFCQAVLDTIAETKALLNQMERAIERDGQLSAQLRDVVRAYNRKILAYSSDQIIPTHRPFGGRWFDDFTIPASMVDELKINLQPA